MIDECGTLDFLADLDKASDTRKANLCRTWKNALMNEHGVYIENRIDIDVYKSKNKHYPRITIHCALVYPKVYYTFDIMGATCGGCGYPGSGYRNFDVHEHAANVCLMVEHELRSRITKDHKIPESMIKQALAKFKSAIISNDEKLPDTYAVPCKRCGLEISHSISKENLCPACYALNHPRTNEEE